jgi:hypothetical protein
MYVIPALLLSFFVCILALKYLSIIFYKEYKIEIDKYPDL